MHSLCSLFSNHALALALFVFLLIGGSNSIINLHNFKLCTLGEHKHNRTKQKCGEIFFCCFSLHLIIHALCVCVCLFARTFDCHNIVVCIRSASAHAVCVNVSIGFFSFDILPTKSKLEFNLVHIFDVCVFLSQVYKYRG